VFLVLVALALSVFVVLLIREVRTLRTQLADAEQALIREQTKDSLATGERVGPLALTAADGTTREIAFNGPRPTLVLMTSAHCPYCDETLPVWQRIFEQVGVVGSAAPAADIICIQADARSPGDLKFLSAPLTPLMPQPGATTWLSRIPIAPGAVFIGADCIVKKAWFGVPSDRDQRQMADLLLGSDLGK